MVRKSYLIGKVINGFYVCDSFHIGTQTKFKVVCCNCKKEQIKGWHSINDKKTECEFCGNGIKKRNTKGYYGTPLHNVYTCILRRINNNGEHYKYYKDKNITMCDEWQNDFKSFYNWAIANGYKKGLTIDRIDNNKNYQPDNCRWATPKEQANNRTNNILFTYKGKTLTAAQWADEYNLPHYLVYNRLRANWSIERTLTEKIDIRKRAKNIAKEGNQIHKC